MSEIIIKNSRLEISRETIDIPYVANAFEVFTSLKADERKSFLLESVDVAPIYGQLSIFCVDPVVEVIGFSDHFVIQAIDKAGEEIINNLPEELFDFCDEIKRQNNSIVGKVSVTDFLEEETRRPKRITPATILQRLLEYFKTEETHFGLYGATSYDFVRYFEDLPKKLPVTDSPYFHFYIPGTLVVHDHFREQIQAFKYSFNNKTTLNNIVSTVKETQPQQHLPLDFKVGKLDCNYTQAAFEDGVKRAQDLMHQGYLFEIVLSKKYQGSFNGSALGVYQKYRKMNPSPYMFYFNFGKEVLLGASPEMFTRVEGNIIQTRPISGTVKRGMDAMSDFENMMKLLNSSKEKAELDMLIDLGRNDVARVSLPGVTLSDYRFVEKYSRVMHTVAHVEGKLAPGFNHLDAFFALLNAGTLTGAPKVEAMKRIEEFEPARRDWYGGSIGYFTASGRLDSGITIRAATIKNQQITLQAGATLLLDSVPELEWQETEDKLQALMETINN